MRKMLLILASLLLSFFGGFFDIYCLLYRGGKFAFLQTGNILYLANDIIIGNTIDIILILILFSSFILGLIIAYLSNCFFAEKVKKEYKHIFLLTLIFLLITPNYFFDKTINLDLSIIPSACLGMIGGILLMSFRDYYVTFTSTMMTNNTKLLVDSFLGGVINKNKGELNKSLFYLFVILSFIFGVITYSLIFKFTLNRIVAPIIGQIIILIVMVIEILTMKMKVIESEK